MRWRRRRPVGNGDVNGDGAIDISDAITSSPTSSMEDRHPCRLFARRPGFPPLGKRSATTMPEQRSTARAPTTLARTASTSGLSERGTLRRHGDGTVTDTCTGLKWQKDTADVNGAV